MQIQTNQNQNGQISNQSSGQAPNNNSYSNQVGTNITTQEIQALQKYFTNQHPELDFNNVFTQLAKNFRTNYPSPKEITKIASFIQVQEPEVPLTEIVQELYKNVQQKRILIQEADLIYKWIKINYPDQSTQNIIAQIYDYTYIGQPSYGQTDQIQLKGHKSMLQNQYMYSKIQKDKQMMPNSMQTQLQRQNENVKVQPIQEDQLLKIEQNQTLDQVSQLKSDSIRQFKGFLLESLTTQRDIESFKNQKKIIHVFTKKGYGIQYYQEYLKKRKLDQKQWKFFREQLVKKNRYEEYFQTALRLTLYSIQQFLKVEFNRKGLKMFSLKQGPFQRLFPYLKNLQFPYKDYLNKALKVIYELNQKEDDKIRQKQILMLHQQIIKISKQVQKMYISSNK